VRQVEGLDSPSAVRLEYEGVRMRRRPRHLLRNGLLKELWGHGHEVGLAEVEGGYGPF
jgi:hypothetical protein